MLRKMGQKYLNHTSLRVADPKRSLDFYEKHFGMKLLKQSDFKDAGFSQYLLGLTGPNSLYKDAPYFSRGGLLQLTHKHGSTVENFQASNGNKEPHRGFGHICFTVADMAGTCKALEDAGVAFQKRMQDGRQKYIAFALDPDGYWIELVGNYKEEADPSLAESSTRLNHTMIRVKDRDASLDFYQKKLGLSLVDVKDFPEAKFTLYFLSYEPQHTEKNGVWQAESLVELTYNYGSEKDDSVKYHTGNTDPLGFSHVAVVVDEPEALVKTLESEKVEVVQPFGHSAIKGVATVADPDGYYVQIIPKSDYLSNASL